MSNDTPLEAKLISQGAQQAVPVAEEVQNALGYSRNFATAKPNIGSMEKEHILGLCNLLERVSRQAAPVAVPRYGSSNSCGEFPMIPGAVPDEPMVVATLKWACSEGSSYYAQCKDDLPETLLNDERELMTVAQHKRIVAALGRSTCTPPAQQPVAWISIEEPFHGEGGIEAGDWDIQVDAKAIDKLAEDNSPGRIPLYTAPPAQQSHVIRAAYEVLLGCIKRPEIAALIDVPGVEEVAKQLNNLLPGHVDTPAQQSQWVPVSERLPEIDTPVFLYEPNFGIWIGGCADADDGWMWAHAQGTQWFADGKWKADLFIDDDYKPSHWMPLPAAPGDTAAPEQAENEAPPVHSAQMDDLASLVGKLVQALRKASPDEPIAEQAMDYLRRKRLLSPLRQRSEQAEKEAVKVPRELLERMFSADSRMDSEGSQLSTMQAVRDFEAAFEELRALLEGGGK